MRNLHGMTWTRWRSIPPPPLSPIWGLYDGDTEKPMKGEACKRGCCFNADFCSGMVPPMWWAKREPQQVTVTGGN